MDEWKKFNETTLSEKEEFYSNLKVEEITDPDYMHGKKVCKDLGEYHDLCLKSDKLLLADVFENFRNMWTNIFELDPAKFISAPGLAWKAALKKTEVKLELLTDIYILLMVKNELEEEYVMQCIIMWKLITNIWKIMIKINNHRILNIRM